MYGVCIVLDEKSLPFPAFNGYFAMDKEGPTIGNILLNSTMEG